MAGLVPAIHVLLAARTTWMSGTRPGMTESDRALLPKAPARLLLLLAGLVVAALHGEVGFFLLFLGPVPERIAHPRHFQVEDRELQRLPDVDRALHELAHGQGQRRIGPGQGGVD